METSQAIGILTAYGTVKDAGAEPHPELHAAYLHAHAHMLRRGYIDVVFCDSNGKKPLHMHCKPTEKYFTEIARR